MSCCFSTDITDELSCSPNGQFNDYCFLLVKCEKYTCSRYLEARKSIIVSAPTDKQLVKPKIVSEVAEEYYDRIEKQ